MTLQAILTIWSLGLVSGMRHAFEPDHMAAVSTLVAEGHGRRRAAWLGAWWGLGHTAALLVVSILTGVLRAEVPARFEQFLELGVAVMLLALGLRAVRRGVLEMRTGPDQWHEHNGTAHRHPATGHHVHVGRWALSPRSFVIGVVHGLAGSGSLVALSVVEIPSTPVRLLFVALFGLGSVAAMAALTGLAGAQVARFTHTRNLSARLQIAAGALSCIIGCLWALPHLS
jgi:hypothetical protein